MVRSHNHHLVAESSGRSAPSEGQRHWPTLGRCRWTFSAWLRSGSQWKPVVSPPKKCRKNMVIRAWQSYCTFKGWWNYMYVKVHEVRDLTNKGHQDLTFIQKIIWSTLRIQYCQIVVLAQISTSLNIMNWWTGFWCITITNLMLTTSNCSPSGWSTGIQLSYSFMGFHPHVSSGFVIQEPEKTKWISHWENQQTHRQIQVYHYSSVINHC